MTDGSCTAGTTGDRRADARAEFLAAAGALTLAFEACGDLDGAGSPLSAGEVGVLLAASLDGHSIVVEHLPSAAAERLARRELAVVRPLGDEQVGLELTARGVVVATDLAARIGAVLDGIPLHGADDLTRIVNAVASRLDGTAADRSRDQD